jgi:hypothetical protein
MSRPAPHDLDGAPGGCLDCYARRPSALDPSAWVWTHGEPIAPQRRPYALWDGAAEVVEHCTCGCHGPGGEPVPRFAAENLPHHDQSYMLAV